MALLIVPVPPINNTFIFRSSFHPANHRRLTGNAAHTGKRSVVYLPNILRFYLRFGNLFFVSPPSLAPGSLRLSES
jgi:hypothetical protein